MFIYEFVFKGKYNIQNLFVLGIIGCILDICKEIVCESFFDFVNVEYCFEFVVKVYGIEFINDFKVINVNFIWFVLESMEYLIVWIVGGVDKGNDYFELIELVKEKVKVIICFGKENDKIKEVFSGLVEIIVEVGLVMEVVVYGYCLVKKDEIVFFFLVCVSFDLFENYEDCGN